MEQLSPSYDLSVIADFKEYLINQIDIKSSNTIFEGFTFDGKLFSLSISAQINWSNLLQLPEVIYPITINCKDETTYILSYENRMNFYLAAVGTKNGALQQGTLLKQEVLLATTIEELKAIADTL